MFKKIALTSLVAVTMAGAANASSFQYSDGPDWNRIAQSVFNPAYRPVQNKWAVMGGINFQTGSNAAQTNETRWQAGDFQVGDVSIRYGILDQLFVSVEVANNDGFGLNSYTGAVGQFANPEIGVNWQMWRPAKSFAIDLIGKYGIAWTKDALTEQRIGENNLQAGLRVYGDEGRFQWAAQGISQWAFLQSGSMFEHDSLWNALFKLELEYEVVQKVGLKFEGNYNIYNADKSSGIPIIYDRGVQFGVIFDVAPGVAALQPYVAYHFQTANSENSQTANNDFWQVGLKFGVQF
ncbi:MAG: hypothetical protein FWF34_01025 [Alphaproteobacteria bacterium]|nr:hypothetical protein [Alphaproteobacteria bacterium]MCL2889826.1 hypothetical protein [Alphaproteobacteria bacterium]